MVLRYWLSGIRCRRLAPDIHGAHRNEVTCECVASSYCKIFVQLHAVCALVDSRSFETIECDIKEMKKILEVEVNISDAGRWVGGSVTLMFLIRIEAENDPIDLPLFRNVGACASANVIRHFPTSE